MPKGSASLYPSNFLMDFIECNLNMWHTNNALTKDEEIEASPLTSEPLQWPFLSTGIRMTSFDDDLTKFYMLGNPIVWWLGASSVIAILLIIGLSALTRARKQHTQPEDTLASSIREDKFNAKCRVVLLGWFLHFVPFLLMGRVLYLHHYYPALIFAVMCTGVVVDLIPSERVRNLAISTTLCVVFAVFLKFAPICYGMNGPVDNFYTLRWLSTWDL